MRDGRAGAFLESIGVEVGSTGATPSMAKAIEKALEVNKGAGVAVESPEIKVRRRGSGLERVAVRVSDADLAAAAADEGAVKESLAEDRDSVKQGEHIPTREAEAADGQIVRPRPHPDGCKDEDVLDDDDLAALRALYGIDDQLAAGEIDAAEADRQRTEIDHFLASARPERTRVSRPKKRAKR